MAKCVHGIENCIHTDAVHDEESCFNGWWMHEYICQNCGVELKSQKHSTRMDSKGMFIPPVFAPKDCPRCKGEKSLV